MYFSTDSPYIACSYACNPNCPSYSTVGEVAAAHRRTKPLNPSIAQVQSRSYVSARKMNE